MEQSNQTDKNRFLYPYHCYHGKVKPENLVFNANLQEFAQHVNFICNLETNGKLSPEDSYRKIQVLWTQLESSLKQLGVEEHPFES
jgi:hypothetical protein